MPRAASVLLLALALAPALVAAQEAGPVTMRLAPGEVKLVAGQGATVVATIANGGTEDTYVETPTVEGLPGGVTLAALEGPGGSRPEGTPPGVWLLQPGETKEFTLIFTPNAAVVRGETTVVLHARLSTDQPPLAVPLRVVVLSEFGNPEARSLAAVPPGAWAGLAALLLAGGLALAARSDAGRMLRAQYSLIGDAEPPDAHTQARVLELVRAAPGIGFDELRRASGLRPTALVAQLDALEASGAVVVERSGLRRAVRPSRG